MTSESHILIETCTRPNNKTTAVIAVGNLSDLIKLKASLELDNLKNETKIKNFIEYHDRYNDEFNKVRDVWLSKVKEYKIDNPILYPNHFTYQDDVYIEYGFDILCLKDLRFLDKTTFTIQPVSLSQCHDLSKKWTEIKKV